jgi:hypothetical protein
VIGLAVLLFSLVVFAGNLAGALGGAAYDTPGLLLLIVGAGAIGLTGSIIFLLSLDGPERWRTIGWRAVGWVGMMIAAILPTSWLFLIVPVTTLGGLALLIPPDSVV